MTSLSLKACFLAILIMVICAIFKNIKQDFLPYVRIAGILVFFAMGVKVLLPAITYLTSLFADTEISEYGDTILKSLGVALITGICSEICSESGEKSASMGVELIGKLEILLLCLPLLESVISSIKEVMTL